MLFNKVKPITIYDVVIFIHLFILLGDVSAVCVFVTVKACQHWKVFRTEEVTLYVFFFLGTMTNWFVCFYCESDREEERMNFYHCYNVSENGN